MASPAVIAFHNEQMAQERERVRLRIANGTKASSNLIIGHRMQHPSYKGLPDNSTGSRIQPFFAMKDEVDCPLEHKVAMRGGVLHTDAGQKYAKKVLQRRARDIMNQEAAVEGLPPQPAPLLELDEAESKSLELNTILDAISDAADDGQVFTIPLSELTKLPRLIISLAPSFSEQKIADLIDVVRGIIRTLESMVPEGRMRRPRRADEDVEDDENALASRSAVVSLERILEFLVGLLKYVNMPDGRGKTLAVKGLATRVFSKILKPRQITAALEAPAAEFAPAPRAVIAAAQPLDQFNFANPLRRAAAAEEAVGQLPLPVRRPEAPVEEEEREAPVEEEEAQPAAAAAPAQRETVGAIAVAQGVDLWRAPNYKQFRKYYESYVDSALPSLRVKLRAELQKGTKDARTVMQEIMDSDWLGLRGNSKK